MAVPKSPPLVLPFPIFRISSAVERYLLYDIKLITWLRKTHHILGVLIGTLPQIPQQNVFLGLPLELMPEEARLLSEKGLGYVIDDLESQQHGMQVITLDEKSDFKQGLAREGREAAKAAERKKLKSTERAMRKLGLGSTPDRDSPKEHHQTIAEDEAGETLFSPSVPADKIPAPAPGSQQASYTTETWAVTPATAYPPFQLPPQDKARSLPTVRASSYALFAHLHEHEYYMSPGLRFGCQYLVYPGDPLRFHSHFLALGMDWDEEINLLDLVGGGRLGTGVKKGWLIGGVETNHETQSSRGTSSVARKASEDTATVRQDCRESYNPCDQGTAGAGVRTFCIEWGGM